MDLTICPSEATRRQGSVCTRLRRSTRAATVSTDLLTHTHFLPVHVFCAQDPESLSVQTLYTSARREKLLQAPRSCSGSQEIMHRFRCASLSSEGEDILRHRSKGRWYMHVWYTEHVHSRLKRESFLFRPCVLQGRWVPGHRLCPAEQLPSGPSVLPARRCWSLLHWHPGPVLAVQPCSPAPPAACVPGVVWWQVPG